MNVAEILSARLIGTMFVERGVLSESQIRVALEIQRETGQQLGQILVDRFGVSRQELASIVAEQWADIGKSTPTVDAAANESWRKLGEIFVERGFVTREQLDQALERQRETGERVGEALVAQGSISKFELAGALAEQMSALEAAEGSPDAEPTAANVLRLMPHPDERPAEPVLELAPEPEAEPESVPTAELELVEFEASEAEHLAELEPEAEPEPDSDPAAELAVVDDGGSKAEPEPELDGVEDAAPAPALEDPPHEDAPDPHAEPAEVLWPAAERIPVVPPSVEPAGVVERRPESVRSEQDAAAWVAFASTTAGYRLVERSEPLPDAGSTIELPEVGEVIVLRVGRSPLPHDERTCVFLEQVARPDAALAR